MLPPPHRTSVALVALVLLVAGCQVGAQAPTATGAPAAGTRLTLPASPSRFLPDGDGVWVATDDGTLTRFDTRTGQVDGTPVRLPFSAATLAAGHGALWLTGQVEGERRVTAKGNYPVIKLARVDPAARRVAAVRALPLRSNGNHLAVTGDGVWVSDPAEGPASRIYRVDPDRFALAGRPLQAGQEPVALAVHEGRLWVANHDDGTLRRIDPATGNVEATIDLGVEPHGMAIGAGAVWIADGHHNAVMRIDPGTGRIVARIDAGFETGMVAASDAGVWVAAAGGADLTRNGLARIDPAANRATVVEVEGQVTEITADGSGVWVGIREPDAAFHLGP